jgi:hypothetical protein
MKTVAFSLLTGLLIACNAAPAPPSSATSVAPSGHPTTLDGRSFRIETMVDGRSEGQETVSFKNGQFESPECSKWGFGPAVYTSPDGRSFSATLMSDAEGRMDWQGTVDGKSISGGYVWKKAGQNDITYTFKGEEVR